MKIYVAITGLLFGLLTAVHIWRVAEEGVGLLKSPWWVLVTAIAAAMCLWAARLVWQANRRGKS